MEIYADEKLPAIGVTGGMGLVRWGDEYSDGNFNALQIYRENASEKPLLGEEGARECLYVRGLLPPSPLKTSLLSFWRSRNRNPNRYFNFISGIIVIVNIILRIFTLLLWSKNKYL